MDATTKLDVKQEAAALLDRMGVARDLYTGGDMASFSPVTGERIASLKTVSVEGVAAVIDRAEAAFRRGVMFPRRAVVS